MTMARSWKKKDNSVKKWADIALARGDTWQNITAPGENRKLNGALISALLERWRSETHTFHLLIGETIVALQDVNILRGLQIEGNVVSRADLTLNSSQIKSLFENLMGEELPIDAFNWRPYDNVFHLLPGICLSGQASWSTSLNVGEVGTSSQHLSQCGTQNYEDAGPSGYNSLQNYNEFQSQDFNQDIQQDFLSPSLVTPFYPHLSTPPAPGFHHLPDMRPPRDRSLYLELDMFDLNTSMDYTNKDNDDNDNLATRRGQRQIRRPRCGTH
ncbi:hypothetical protein E3N88_03972 [Mikania micrantha]|uniref:Aminotransferase-like plant mobile domain-containing protein n=1 Tax=Mikania micrantha TaxID=192012 RepID=A0A5N6PT25_9ASTR|nr:hypothetical protein E3N88_03972 [Mikania micrantha]